MVRALSVPALQSLEALTSSDIKGLLEALLRALQKLELTNFVACSFRRVVSENLRDWDSR